MARKKNDGRAVVLFSSGMDSMLLLQRAIEARGADNVTAFIVDYGQRHSIEVIAANATCQDLGVRAMHVQMGALVAPIMLSALTDRSREVRKRGHQERGAYRNTYVPNRNMVLLSLAIAYAEAHDHSEVHIGVNKTDVSPDCSSAFVTVMANASRVATCGTVQVRAPLVRMDKLDIFSSIHERLIPFTWTCYDPQEDRSGLVKPCMKCRACTERLATFNALGMVDPFTTEDGVVRFNRWLEQFVGPGGVTWYSRT